MWMWDGTLSLSEAAFSTLCNAISESSSLKELCIPYTTTEHIDFLAHSIANSTSLETVRIDFSQSRVFADQTRKDFDLTFCEEEEAEGIMLQVSRKRP